MSLDIETIDAIKSVFNKPPHNMGHHSYKFEVIYGNVIFDENTSDDDWQDCIEEIENQKDELEFNLEEIQSLCSRAINNDDIDKEQLIEILDEIYLLSL